MLTEKAFLMIDGRSVCFAVVIVSTLTEIISFIIEVAKIVGHLELSAETVLLRKSSELFQRYPNGFLHLVVTHLHLR